MVNDLTFEIYVALVTLFSAGAGVWFAIKISKPKKIEERELSLTSREHEVLQLLTQGLSNAEIANKLFLSLSTVKTHVSTLFVKLGVKNRTQALEKANRLKITLHA